MFHFNQRHKVKSNHKTDRGNNESGKIQDATKRRDLEMITTGADTYSAFLDMRRQKAPDPRHVTTMRTRSSLSKRGTAKSGYHPELTEDLRTLAFEKIF